jgi:hypothetical protein
MIEPGIYEKDVMKWAAPTPKGTQWALSEFVALAVANCMSLIFH